MKLKPLYRSFDLDRASMDEEKRTVELSFSSEEPYGRYFGQEILDHGKGSIRLGRLEKSGPFLVDHDPSDVVGVIEDVRVEGNRGKAQVRFGRSARADEIYNDVVDGIRTSISVGYRVHSMVLESKGETEADNVYRVNDWEPFEVSSVSVPADVTVGVGRSGDAKENDVQIINKIETEERSMTKETKTETRAAEPVITEPKVDVKEVEKNARKAEQDRIRSITVMGDKFGKTDLARSFIENGSSADNFREELLNTLDESSPLQEAKDPSIGLTEKEAKNFSFVKAVTAMANPNDRKAQEAAAFEYECSRAAQEATGKDPQGVLIPYDVLSRDLIVGTPSAGGDLVSTDLLSGSFIDMLRNSLALTNSGATVLDGLNGNIAIPRQTGGATGYWVAESGAPTASQQAVDQVTMSPNTVGAFTDYSRKLMLQSSISVENFVRNDLATTLALEIDRAGINGSGAGNQPTGIINTAGIGAVAGGANGLAPAWSHIVDLETAIANANAATGSLSYLTNTKVRGKLKQTEKFAGANGMTVFTDDAANPLNGYRAIVSNQVPSNLTKGASTAVCSAIIFGNFADLLIGMWGGLDLLVDPYTASTTGTVRVVVLQDVDVAVRHPESFAAMLDALTA